MTRLVLVAACVASGLFPAAVSRATAGPADAPFVPGELLVRFDRDAGTADRAAAVDRVDGEVREGLGVPRLKLVEIHGIGVQHATETVERHPGVSYAEPNFVHRFGAAPNDIYFGSQWALHNTGQGVDLPPVSGTPDADIDAVEAWNRSIGGSNVVVGIADTGVFYNHPDLAPNIYRNPGESGGGKETNGVDDDGNGLVDDFRGYDFFANDNDPAPTNPPAPIDDHGTGVAGAAGARGGNSIGITGATQRTSLLPLRVGDGPTGPNVAAEIKAFAYAGRLGAEVVNLSAGFATFSQGQVDAIRSAPNTLFVFAALNDSINVDNPSTPLYPCRLNEPNVVCVAATDLDDELTSFSNFGPQSVDLAAPGVRILVTDIGTHPANAYRFTDGTSFSSPITAGAAAVYRSRYPQATAAQTRNALRAGVDRKPSLANRVESGGRLNLDRTLAIPPPAPPRPTDTSIALTVRAKGKQKVGKLRVTVGCGDEACEAELGGKARAKKKRFRAKAKDLSIRAGELRTQRVKFTRNKKTVRKLRKLLKRRPYRKRTKANLKVSATDTARNTASEQVKVTLKR